MANPQTEHGFVQVALDLFAAIMAADLSNAEMIVLAEVILPCYGEQKRRSVHLDPATIEHYTGVHRNNARAAIRSLEAAGILRVGADGAHAIVKDYEAWRPRGRPFVGRLGGGLLRFARSALTRFVRINRSKKDPIQPAHLSEPAPIQPDRGEAPDPNPAGLALQVSGQSNRIDPLNKVRAAEELIRIKKGEGEGEPPPSISMAPEAQSPTLPAVPAPDPAAVARLVEKAQRLTADLAYGMAVFRHAPDWRLDWLERAIEETAGAGTSDFRYTLGILRGYKARGGPRAAPAGRSVVPAPEPRSAAYEFFQPDPPVPPEEAARRRAARAEMMARLKVPMFATPDAPRARRRDLA